MNGIFEQKLMRFWYAQTEIWN